MTGLPVVGQTKNFEDALRANPTILSKQALVQAAEAGEKVAKAAFAPTVDLRASTGRDREQPGALYRDVQSSRVQLMLDVSPVPWWCRLRTPAPDCCAKLCRRDVRDYACRNVQQELSIAWNNIQRFASSCLSCASMSCRPPKCAWLTSSDSSIGQRSLLDLLDTENELFDARRALLNARSTT